MIATGELIIDVLKLINNDKANVALPCLRNIYETKLKSIVLDDNNEIKMSYN